MFDRLRTIINNAIKARKEAKRKAKTLKSAQKIIDTLKKQTSGLLAAAKMLRKEEIQERLEKSKDELKKEAKKLKDQGKELNQKSLTPHEWKSLSNKLLRVKNHKRSLETTLKYERAFLKQAIKSKAAGEAIEKKISVLKAPDVAKNLKKGRKNLETTYKKLSTKYGSKNFKDFKNKLTEQEKNKLKDSILSIKKDKVALGKAAKDQKEFKLEGALKKRSDLLKGLQEKYDSPKLSDFKNKLTKDERNNLINSNKEVKKHRESQKPKIETKNNGQLSPSATPSNKPQGHSRSR